MPGARWFSEADLHKALLAPIDRTAKQTRWVFPADDATALGRHRQAAAFTLQAPEN